MAVFPSTAAAEAEGRIRRPRTKTGRDGSVRGPNSRTQKAAYAFIAPIAVGFLVFYIWPMIQTFGYSFTSFGPFGGNSWVGATITPASSATSRCGGRSATRFCTGRSA